LREHFLRKLFISNFPHFLPVGKGPQRGEAKQKGIYIINGKIVSVK
jgi:hypothetical protein